MAKKNEFAYVIDLDERGYFESHVENWQGKEIFSISNCHVVFDDETGEEIGEEYGEICLVEDGFMKHGRDVNGLFFYLVDIKVIPTDSTLTLLDAHI
jgi:hypothetical protein